MLGRCPVTAAGRPTRAALYTRVSTKEQASEGTSLETQLARLRAHAAANCWQVVGEFVDEGVSGDLPVADRPEASRLMGLCRRGSVDVVAVKDLDRFGRDVVETLTAERELERARVAFVSIGEGLDTRRDSDRLNLQLRAVIAEQEKRRMLERMTAGLRARAVAGDWPGGPAPFGFRLEPGPSGRNRLAVDREESAVVREAVSLVVDRGHSTWEAARLLNELSLLPRTRTRWEHANLRRVLLSPTLGGAWTYKSKTGPVEMGVPAILEPVRRAALLDALGATSTGPRSVTGNVHLLSHGRLVGACGAAYHGLSRPERESRWYRCRSKRPEAAVKCEDVNVHADSVEAIVWAEVTALLSEPDRLVRMAEEYLDLEPEREGAEHETLEAIDEKLAALDGDRTHRVAVALEAGVDAATLRSALGQLDDRARSLRAHRARLGALAEDREATADRVERLRALAATARERLGSMGPLERRAVLELLDVRVTVTGWKPCERCEGKGKLKGGRGGLACPACHAQRRVPSLRVEGVVLDDLRVEQLGAEVPRRSTCSAR